jgi:hypothetical protein
VTGVTAAAPDVTAVTRNVAPIDKIESEADRCQTDTPAIQMATRPMSAS